MGSPRWCRAEQPCQACERGSEDPNRCEPNCLIKVLWNWRASPVPNLTCPARCIYAPYWRPRNEKIRDRGTLPHLHRNSGDGYPTGKCLTPPPYCCMHPSSGWGAQLHNPQPKDPDWASISKNMDLVAFQSLVPQAQIFNLQIFWQRKGSGKL